MLKHIPGRNDVSDSQDGSVSDKELAKINQVTYSSNSINQVESIEPTRPDNGTTTNEQRGKLRSSEMVAGIIKGDKIKTTNTTTSNIYGSDSEETTEKMKDGDKTLTYYKRRSMSPSLSTHSDDFHPLQKDLNENIEIQRSSIMKRPVAYANDYWKTDDVARHSPSCYPIKEMNTEQKMKVDLKQHDYGHQVYSRNSPCFIPSHRTKHFSSYSHQTDNSRRHDSSLNSSKQSDDSYNKRYLDLSGDRYEHSIIENRNVASAFRKVSVPSTGTGCSVNKYGSTRSCRSPSSINFPFDPSELTIQPINDKTNVTQNAAGAEDNDMSEEIIERRIQICKFVAIFCIVVTAIICLLFGILHFYVGYYPQLVNLNEGDIKLLTASSSFCSNIIAVSRTSNLRVITYKRKSNSKSIENTITGDLKIVPSAVWRRDFYIQHGSTVSMKIHSIYSLDVLIFAGKKKYLIWSQRKQSDTYMKKVSCCGDSKEKKKTIIFTAPADERYYIVIHNQIEVIPVAVYLEITFFRISPDFTETTHHCLTTAGKTCSVGYSFNNGEDVALEIPLSKEATTIPESSEVEWKCVARVWFYAVLFILVFIVMSAGIFAIYYITVTFCFPSKRYCCAIRKKEKMDSSSEFLYHNKHVNNDLANTNKSQKDFSTSNKTSLYNNRQLSPTRSTRSAFSKHLHRPNSHTKHHESDIATIYDRNRFIGDAADSGISLGADCTPTRHSSYKHDIIQLQELQIQQLKTLRTNQQQSHQFLTDGPRVNQLIKRERSDISSGENYTYGPNYGYRPNSMNRNSYHNYTLSSSMSSREENVYEPTLTMSTIRGHYKNQARRSQSTSNNIKDSRRQTVPTTTKNVHELSSEGRRSRNAKCNVIDQEMYI